MVDTKLEQLKIGNPILKVAALLGLRTNGTKAVKCFNFQAHKHEDKNPSFTFQTQVNRFYCYGCGIKGDVIDLVQLVKGVRFRDAVLFLDPNYYEKETGVSRSHIIQRNVVPQEYLHSRGFSDKTIRKFGLTLVKHNGFDAIKIPLPTGNRYRMLQGNIRYLYDKGTIACLLKTQSKASCVVLCEGEFDAYIIDQETEYAAWTGTSGVKTFDSAWIKDFGDVDKIYIAFDNDEAGRSSVEELAERLGEERCYRLEVPKQYGKDWNDFFLNGGTKEIFNELIKSARPCKQNIASRYAILKSNSQKALTKIPTGFKRLDSILDGGLRTGNTYQIAGLKESGKTAFALTIVNSLLSNSERVGYIDTEMGLNDLSNRMAAIHFNITTQKAEDDPDYVRKWIEKFQDEFLYASHDENGDLAREGIFDFELAWERIERFVKNGARIIFIDNLTSFAIAGATDNIAEWQVTSKIISRLVTYAKSKNIVIIFISHVKPSTVFSETPKGIKTFIDQGRYEDIFTGSLSIPRKPTLADVYGGGTGQSQLSGVFIIWRPFQKVFQPTWSSQAQLVMESLRHGAAENIRLTFHGDRSTFTENFSRSDSEKADPNEILKEFTLDKDEEKEGLF